ncbi:unnamed protein product [Nezara viridula]|uniref:Uncharacterized protein n=1 Tax=Nezara viridula TaxID=85310 RepID=A0A9P0MYG2_NEZVI|nr:unnamed protein product [Nezara viridula]
MKNFNRILVFEPLCPNLGGNWLKRAYLSPHLPTSVSSASSHFLPLSLSLSLSRSLSLSLLPLSRKLEPWSSYLDQLRPSRCSKAPGSGWLLLLQRHALEGLEKGGTGGIGPNFKASIGTSSAYWALSEVNWYLNTTASQLLRGGINSNRTRWLHCA